MARQDGRRRAGLGYRLALTVAGIALIGLSGALVMTGFRRSAGGAAASAAETRLPQVPALKGLDDTIVVAGDSAPLVPGQPAPDFAAATLDGETVRLSDFRGRPVIVNFWATWCPPCRQEMPDLQQAYLDHQADRLAILALNQDEPADVVQAYFYEEHSFSYTPLLDEGGRISLGYGVVGFPTSVFVGSDGQVTAVHRGLLLPSQLADYLAQLLPAGS